MTTGGPVQMMWKDCCWPVRSLCWWWSSERADRKLVSLTPCTYSLSSQIPQNCKVIGGWHSVGQLRKGEAETGRIRASEDKKTPQIKKKKRLTSNDINLAADIIPITASVMEHVSIMGTPFARLEKATRHYSISMMFVSAEKEEQRAIVQKSSVMEAWDASPPTLRASQSHMSHNTIVVSHCGSGAKLAPSEAQALTRAKRVMPAPTKAAM